MLLLHSELEKSSAHQRSLAQPPSPCISLQRSRVSARACSELRAEVEVVPSNQRGIGPVTRVTTFCCWGGKKFVYPKFVQAKYSASPWTHANLQMLAQLNNKVPVHQTLSALRLYVLTSALCQQSRRSYYCHYSCCCCCLLSDQFISLPIILGCTVADVHPYQPSLFLLTAMSLAAHKLMSSMGVDFYWTRLFVLRCKKSLE